MFYELAGSDFAIEGIDKSPISSIRMTQPRVINGVVCNTVSEYLRQQYRKNPKIASLDDSQPGLKSGAYTFAPQFLYRTIDFGMVNRTIQIEESFLMDDLPPNLRDDQKPATLRWELIHDYFGKYGFQMADLGPVQLGIAEPMSFSLAYHYQKPKLRCQSTDPVSPELIEQALEGGMYAPPKISNIFMYSVVSRDFSLGFYADVVKFAKEKFGVVLPANPIMLERDIMAARNQLQSWARSNSFQGAFSLGIIPLKSGLHRDFTNMVGSLGIPS